jgi:hypothetical protein
MPLLTESLEIFFVLFYKDFAPALLATGFSNYLPKAKSCK